MSPPDLGHLEDKDTLTSTATKNQAQSTLEDNLSYQLSCDRTLGHTLKPSTRNTQGSNTGGTGRRDRVNNRHCYRAGISDTMCKVLQIHTALKGSEAVEVTRVVV